MKKVFIICAAVLFLFTVMSKSATASMKRLRGDTITVKITDDYGNHFSMYYPLYDAYGSKGRVKINRRYLQALRGKRYAITIRNNSRHRIGMVIAVDGRNIISGKKSYLERDERMYIVRPYGRETFNGWRTGRDTVNRFYFTTAGKSYAHAWRDDTAMGVIAIAVYREFVPEPRRMKPHSYKGERGLLDSGRKGLKESPGTGFGEEEYSPSRVVAFRPQKRPAEKIFIKYEWRSTLCRMEIVQCRPGYRETPNRFWDDPYRNQGYAPYPPHTN